MTNTRLLEARIAELGLKKGYLAQECGLSRAGFRNCVTNKASFKPQHIDILCVLLKIRSLKEKNEIFFAKSGS